MEIKQTELRRKLEEIVNSDSGISYKEKILNKRKLIMVLNNHTIKVYEDILKDFNTEELLNKKNYLCVSYAFSLYKNDINNADNKFTEFLIEKKYIKKKNQPKNADYLLYFNDDYVIHIGAYKNDRIISKWGTNDIFEHKIEEVPLKYGNKARYYEKIGSSDIYNYYLEFEDFNSKYVQIRDNLNPRLNQICNEEKDRDLIKSGVLALKDSVEIYLFIQRLKNDRLRSPRWSERIRYLDDLCKKGLLEYFNEVSKSSGKHNSQSLMERINKKFLQSQSSGFNR